MPAALFHSLAFFPPLRFPSAIKTPPPSFLSYSTNTRAAANGSVNGNTNLHLSTTAAADQALLQSCWPAAAWANVVWFKSGNYNVQIIVGEEEPEESLLRRFRREVMKAGVIQECKRRRWFEDNQAKRKRKARNAAQRNRKRYPQSRGNRPPDKQEKGRMDEEEEEDNWELPVGELPY